MDLITNYLTSLFVTYPWLGPTCAALYFVSEALGANAKIKENTVYQALMTFVKGIFGKFYTPVSNDPK